MLQETRLLTQSHLFNQAADTWALSRGFDISGNTLQTIMANNNLSDLTDLAAARVNLGLQIGANVQAWSAALDRYATISPSDLTLTLLSQTTASAWRTGLGVVTGSGTVTSVNLSGGSTGLTVSGGPIISAGTLTLDGTLSATNGGTGVTSLGALKIALNLNNVTNLSLPLPLPNQLLAWNATGDALVNVNAPPGGAASGNVMTSGLTMNSGFLLGRSTTATGAIEQIGMGIGLLLNNGQLISNSIMAGVTSAPAGRAALGGSIVGSNLFTLINPGAVSFLRVNADNSISALSAAAMRTAVGAGTGNGDLLSTNNLSDLISPTAARTNIGAAGSGPVISSGLTVGTGKILGRTAASTGAIEELTLSQVLDQIGLASQGDLLYRGASGWSRLPAGTAGYVLASGGPGANISWSASTAGYTDEMAQDATAAMLAAGTHTNLLVTYNDAANAMSLAVTGVSTPSSTDTLTNKTLSLATNSVSGTLAQFNTALTDADFAVGWTVLGTISPTTGSSVSFANIPQIYNELMLTIDGAGTSSGTTINVLLSFTDVNGTSSLVSGILNNIFNSGDFAISSGAVLVPGYRYNSGVAMGCAGDPGSYAVSWIPVAMGGRCWRCPGGIRGLTLYVSSGQFRTGVFTLSGR